MLVNINGREFTTYNLGCSIICNFLLMLYTALYLNWKSKSLTFPILLRTLGDLIHLVGCPSFPPRETTVITPFALLHFSPLKRGLL